MNEAIRLELIVKLTLAKLEIIKLKYANNQYYWACCGEKGQELLNQTEKDIDEQLVQLKSTKN